jgi:hypothetical protein
MLDKYGRLLKLNILMEKGVRRAGGRAANERPGARAIMRMRAL